MLVDAAGSVTNTRLVDAEQGQAYEIKAVDGPQQQQIFRFCRLQRARDTAATITFRLHLPPLIWLERWPEPVAVDSFFPRISKFRSKLSRRFMCSDGQPYIWTRKLRETEEWTCTNGRDYHVAYYALPSEVHPKPILFIDESFKHLDIQLIATLYAARLIHE